MPKSGDGRVEMIRVLRSARRSAIKARTQAANQLKGLRVTAPEELLNRLRGLPTKELVSVAARFRPGDGPHDVPTATKFALRSVARRYEILLKRSSSWRRTSIGWWLKPPLSWSRCRASVPTERRDTLARGRRQSPEVGQRGILRQPLRRLAHRGLLRQGREAPSQGSGGNREANRALYMICLSRMRRDLRTQQYVARRTAEGKSKREIIRCLKRYLAREVYRVLVSRVGCCSSTRP